MSVHGRRELERENRLIRRATRASLMSDTKWRKLFSALEASDLNLTQYIVKFVGVTDEKVMHRHVGLYPPKPWIDSSPFGPVPLRSIEWLLLPRWLDVSDHDRTIPVRRVEQDVDEAARIVTALGRFPMELSERGLLILGHLPSPPAA